MAIAQQEEDIGEFQFRDSKMDSMASHALEVIMNTAPKKKRQTKKNKPQEIETADQNDDFSDFNMFIEIQGENEKLPETHELLLDEEMDHEESVVSRVTTDFGAPQQAPKEVIPIDTVSLIN